MLCRSMTFVQYSGERAALCVPHESLLLSISISLVHYRLLLSC